MEFRFKTHEPEFRAAYSNRPEFLQPGVSLTEENVTKFLNNLPIKLEVKFMGQTLNEKQIDELLSKYQAYEK